MVEFELRGPSVVHREDGIIFGKYEPGNGTSYKALATPVKGMVDCGWLGSIRVGWIVVSGMANCRGYLIPSNIHLDVGWVAEKFDLVGVDVEMFTKLLEAMLK